jgi:hypothetical protein
MLQTATTRAHTDMVSYLLEQFPAKYLHMAEWEVVVNAIAKGSVELLKPFVQVDPPLVNLYDPRFGTCFTVLFELVHEKELHLPVVRFLVENGADLCSTPNLLQDAESSTLEVREYIKVARWSCVNGYVFTSEVERSLNESIWLHCGQG